MLKYIQESLAKFENQIKRKWVYVRRITRSTIFEKAPFLAGKRARKLVFKHVSSALSIILNKRITA